MQTCSRCSTQSPDFTVTCPGCQASLREWSTTGVALKNFLGNPRVKFVRISVSGDACPACSKAQGNYPKESVPQLPVAGCSNPLGCHCFYDPVLEVLFP